MKFSENNREFNLEFDEAIQVGASSNNETISDMSYMFYYDARMNTYESILKLCKDVTKASYCFAYSNIETFDSSNFPNTNKCGSFSSMFDYCYYLTRADLSHLDCSSMAQSNGSGFYNMFRNCAELEEVIGFAHKSSQYPNTRMTFSQCPKLKRLTFSNDVGALKQMNIDISECSFEREGMVELFNSLPTVEQKSLLTITNNPCITGRLITEMPGGEYDGYIMDAETLIAVLNENVFSDEASCMVEDSMRDMNTYIKEILIMRADSLSYPVRLEWREYTIEAETEKLTDADRLIVEGKGWSLIE